MFIRVSLCLLVELSVSLLTVNIVVYKLDDIMYERVQNSTTQHQLLVDISYCVY